MTQLKDYIKQHPMLMKFALLIQTGSVFKRSVTRRIRGQRNRIQIDQTAFCVGCVIDVVGNNNTIIVQESARLLNLRFFIRGNNNRIVVSSQVRVNRDGDLWIEDDGGTITIGEQCTFEAAHIAVTEPGSSITIGRDCLFAYDIDIRTGDSHSIIDTQTDKRINYARDVLIGDHVWIAAHCSILKGVRLGRNSVVATRSVVTKPFDQEGVIVGGNPARILKENVTWQRERLYPAASATISS